MEVKKEDHKLACQLCRKVKEYDRRIDRCKNTIARLEEEQRKVYEQAEKLCEKIGVVSLW